MSVAGPSSYLVSNWKMSVTWAIIIIDARMVGTCSNYELRQVVQKRRHYIEDVVHLLSVNLSPRPRTVVVLDAIAALEPWFESP